MKYTREVLEAAARESTSVAGVLRYLGLRQAGGTQAHIKRRLVQFGIDISHFSGRGHGRGKASHRRKRPEEILVIRREGSLREKPPILRRALIEIGVRYECVGCLTETWNGRPIVLHVDHVNGDFLDCRRDNLRFLCPNCHSQTDTYAGRNHRRFAIGGLPHVKRPKDFPGAVTAENVAEIIRRVDSGEISAVRAAEQIGCSRGYFYKLRARLEETGHFDSAGKAAGESAAKIARDAAIIEYALAWPEVGPKVIAAALRDTDPRLRVSHGTVSNVLRKAGLAYRAQRREAAKLGQTVQRLDFTVI